MGWREILHRLKDLLYVSVLRLRYKHPIFRLKTVYEIDQFQFRYDAGWLPEPQWDLSVFEELHSRFLEGSWTALGYLWKWESDTSWFLAPDTNNLWPKQFFASIPYREGNPYGDVRVIWEPARLQQLVAYALLIKYGSDHDEKTVACLMLKNQLMSWVKANPYLEGVHYVSAMECGLRLMAVCHAAELARESFVNDRAFWDSVTGITLGHASLIEQRLSLFSSAGNHTLAECAGLIYAGLLFPEHSTAKKWVTQGLSVFESELDRQILADGGGLEQAFWYHLFITDLAGLVNNLLHRHGLNSPLISEALSRAKNFISLFSTGHHDIPNIGDNDSGYALTPLMKISWQDRNTDDPIHIFPDSGYSRLQNGNHILIFDHGPLGMAPSFGHGHADALSIWLIVNGKEILRDSGTFTYTGNLAWRRYFRSTEAHNTVGLVGTSQAKMVSAFRWSAHYRAELAFHRMSDDGSHVFLAWHNGYEQHGFRHWRGIVYRPTEGMMVWDFLEPTSSRPTEPASTIHWHLAGECYLRKDVCVVQNGPGVRCYIRSVQTPVLYYGETSPPNGWHSRTYGQKVPAYTLNIEGCGISKEGVSTLFSFQSADFLDAQCYEESLKELQSQLHKWSSWPGSRAHQPA